MSIPLKEQEIRQEVNGVRLRALCLPCRLPDYYPESTELDNWHGDRLVTWTNQNGGHGRWFARFKLASREDRVFIQSREGGWVAQHLSYEIQTVPRQALSILVSAVLEGFPITDAMVAHEVRALPANRIATRHTPLVKVGDFTMPLIPLPMPIPRLPDPALIVSVGRTGVWVQLWAWT